MRRLPLFFAISAGLIFSVPAFAEEFTIPYPKFLPGTPAYASSINANFEAIQTGVNDNIGKITVNSERITVNTGSIGANANSITEVKDGLATHGHSPGAIKPQGAGSGLDADLLDGEDATSFADSVHGHVPSDLAPQGSGSGLDADMVDGEQATAFADSIHGHTPGEITPQGSGSGLDADLLDGSDSEDFADSVHGHDERYTLIGHTHPAGEITGSINADTLDDMDSSSFAPVDHAHPDYALTSHTHDTEYAVLNHTHEELATAVSDQESRLGKLESYGDLSSALEEIEDLHKTVEELKARIADLEGQMKNPSQ